MAIHKKQRYFIETFVAIYYLCMKIDIVNTSLLQLLFFFFFALASFTTVKLFTIVEIYENSVAD